MAHAVDLSDADVRATNGPRVSRAIAPPIIARAWQHAGLQPHRLDRYMRSTDREFEPKAADVIGLYLQPPQHAVVFSVDEKSAIQALDRLDPVLPMSPGRAERHGFEYYRHSTLSLYTNHSYGPLAHYLFHVSIR